MQIILLNGAPRSGKDTVAKMLKDRSSTSVHLEKFALPLKLSVPLLYGISHDVWRDELDTARNKDLPCSQFFGKTPREVQIALSEDFLKKMHGSNIFGELLSRRVAAIRDRAMLEAVIVSDSGFVDEAMEVVKGFGHRNVQLWRVHREGCDFKRDSREHINLDGCGVLSYDIFNNGSLDDLRDVVIPLYESATLPRDKDEHGNSEPLDEWHRRRTVSGMQAILRQVKPD